MEKDMATNALTEKSQRIKQIIAFCKKGYKSLDEICNELGGVNKNTIRAGYLYPLVKDGVLIRNNESVTRNVKYKTK